MAASFKASLQGIEIADRARRRRGWNKDAVRWCEEAQVSRSTLQRFWRQQAIRRESFVAICRVLGIEDWQSIAADESPEMADLSTAILQETTPILESPATVQTIQSRRNQLTKHTAHLARLQEQLADYGLEKPEALLQEIAHRETCITQLQQSIRSELQRLSPLPNQRYVNFVGRQADIDSVLAALQPSNPRPLIAIDGIGGVGKTALAREVINQSLQANQFYAVVWESAKPAEFVGEDLRAVDSASLNLDTLLTQIGAKLGHFEIRSMKSTDQKRQFVQQLLAQERYLIAIDNLETIAGYRQLVKDLDGLLSNGGKAILTSRRVVAGFRHVQSFQLSGLDLAASLEFLRAYSTGRPRAAAAIDSAGEATLAEIYRLTQGMPLAMELVVGKLENGNTIHATIQGLQSVNYETIQRRESDETIYAQFYRFIYGDSWEQLSEIAQDVLICLGEFALAEGARLDDLQSVTELATLQLEAAVAELTQFSLVSCHDLGHQRTLSIHPLTQLFVQREVLTD